MHFTKLVATVAISLVTATTAAMAAPAVAVTELNVRDGPGTDYRVLDTLRRGEEVDVLRCRGTWCFVEKRGRDGWVSAKYLAAEDYFDDYYDYDDYDRDRDRDRYDRYDDDVDFSFGIYVGPDKRHYPQPEPEPEPDPITRYPTLDGNGNQIYGDGVCYETYNGLVCY